MPDAKTINKTLVFVGSIVALLATDPQTLALLPPLAVHYIQLIAVALAAYGVRPVGTVYKDTAAAVAPESAAKIQKL